MGLGLISIPKVFQAQRLVGFCAQGLVSFPAQRLVGFVLSWSEAECVSLALVTETKGISFTGSGFRTRMCFFGWPIYLAHRAL